MLLLDSGAVSALAHGPAVRRDRVRALIAEMRRRDGPIGTSAAILAEVVRGRPADAGVFSGMRRERVVVHEVDSRTGVRAGQLLGAARAASALAVGAFLVATADLAGGGVVASADVADLGRLAAHTTGVVIAAIG